jgi:hypothetical protein
MKIFALILVSAFSFGVNSQTLVNQNYDDNSLIFRGFDNLFSIVGEPNVQETDYAMECQHCVIKTESREGKLSKNTFIINVEGRYN